MADLPQNSELIFNPINNMSGFSIENRYFFTPGFPEMSHPMISSIIKRLFSNVVKKYRMTLLAQTSENTLIEIMKQIPKEIELSSLPILKENKASVEISLCGFDKLRVERYFNLFSKFLHDSNIEFVYLA
jgi:molybdopterin-biosynthesis enzyme MoeA-like protein